MTSSSATSGGAVTGDQGVPPTAISRVIGVTKAYCTRVGGGPFPTELKEEVGEALRKKGNEFGAVTGRPRRYAAGVSLAGVPFIVAGHNDHVAWGYTGALCRCAGSLRGEARRQGRLPGDGWRLEPLSVDHETIYVRGAEDVIVDVQSTAHGPLDRSAVHEGDATVSVVFALPRPEFRLTIAWTFITNGMFALLRNQHMIASP